MKTTEILLITQEECAEVTQAISKVFRFGMDATHKDKTNRDRLEEEVGDLVCMIELLEQQGLIDHEKVQQHKSQKLEKLKTWSTIFK